MEFTKDIQFNNKPLVNQYLKVIYNGFLCNSSELTIVYGFGESWEHTSELQMQKTADGFVAKINMLNFDTFNFCFRNSNYEWDNNCNCNYITPILPCTNEKIEALFNNLLTPRKEISKPISFDIDALIEEILQPIITNSVEEIENTPLQISSEPVDLGVEITKVLSQIDFESSNQDLIEYSTIDEILSGTVIEQKPIELLEQKTSVDNIVNQNQPSNIQEQYDSFLKIYYEIENIINKVEKEQKIEEKNALVQSENKFIISPRQLSKFYLFRKRLKLAFYKALVKIPKMIFGTEK